jgi:HSP20 family protein
MNRMFDDSYRGAGRGRGLGAGRRVGAAGGHLREGRQHRAEGRAAGVDPKDVDVRLENNTLTLRGERKFDNEVKQEHYHAVERAYGTFTRSFTLPSVLDQEKIKAEFTDGVLQVTLPKHERPCRSRSTSPSPSKRRRRGPTARRDRPLLLVTSDEERR